MQVVHLVSPTIDEGVDGVEVRLERFTGEPDDQVGIRAQAAAPHMDHYLLVGVQLDIGPLDVDQNLIVEGLHGLVNDQRSPHFLH